MKASRTTSLSLLLLLTGCLDSFVGAECADGYTEVDGACVLAADSGMDSGMPDAGLDSSMDASDTSTDASDSSTSDAGDAMVDAGDAGDGGVVTGCDLGETRCGMECVRTRTDTRHCGACDVACAAMELCSGGRCVRSCTPPEVLCDGICFDPSASYDPDNCGSCGNRCSSGICIEGVCADAMAGHVVLIGHDYVSSRRGMQRLAGNTIFLGLGANVDVVAWEGGATPQQVRGIDRAIDRVAAERGRMWTKITPTVDALLEELERADVFLLYPQPTDGDAALSAFGASMARGFRSFLRRGGVVAVFDTPSPMNSGTWQFLTGAGLMTVTSHVDVTGSTLNVTAPGDAIALGADLTYSAEANTVRYEAMAPVVVTHPDGPVVLHEVPVP